jgi:hypothetical protein
MRGILIGIFALSLLITPAYSDDLSENEVIEFFAKESQTNNIYETELLLIKNDIKESNRFYKVMTEIINDSYKIGHNVVNPIGDRNTKNFFTVPESAVKKSVDTKIYYDKAVEELYVKKLPVLHTPVKTVKATTTNDSKIEKIKKIVAVIENTKKINENLVPYEFQGGAETWRFKP